MGREGGGGEGGREGGGGKRRKKSPTPLLVASVSFLNKRKQSIVGCIVLRNSLIQNY